MGWIWPSAVAVFLASAPDVARADVFVPADPPPLAATCVAAAGEVVVAARRVRHGRWQVSASESGGPWRRLARLDRCPLAAAAPDGTVGVAAGQRVLVRRPGGASWAQVALRSGVYPVDVAAAPGGWVGVVGTRARELVAAVAAPDGTTRSTVIARGRRIDGFLTVRIGIGARGAATVAWAVWDSVRGRSVLRTANTADGRAWSPARRLRAPGSSEGQPDVAVAPNGRTLVAWAGGTGVWASLDGAPAARLTSDVAAGSPAIAVADDGSAVVAYAASGRRIVAADRAPGASWSVPRSLYGTAEPPGAASEDSGLAAAIGPDGRAVVAWNVAGDISPRVVAAWGRVGGVWIPAVPLSAITHAAATPSVTLAASGDPRVAWTEAAGDRSVARLRGARLAPKAPPIDGVAPALSTRLPAHTARTRRGEVTFHVPVRCSEACDVRLRLLARAGGEVASAVRELPADRAATLRLETPRHFARRMLMSKRARRPRLEVVVSDRAGNVARRARTVRFRIVDRR
jgi:hypothetical protein